MISAVMIVKDNESTLKEVLKALAFLDEVVVFDTGSKDRTQEIAKSFSNVVWFEGSFDGFGKTKNKAVACAKNDWVFSIDSDEVVTEALQEELCQLSLDEGSVYSVPRNNFYRGKWIKGCGWYPDRVVRLFHRKKTQFKEMQVHEAVDEMDLKVVKLDGALKHTPYKDQRDFLAKMQNYSTLWAKEWAGKKKGSLSIAICRALFTFFKCYILQRGIFLGEEGFIISVYNANTVFYKYLKINDFRNS